MQFDVDSSILELVKCNFIYQVRLSVANIAVSLLNNAAQESRHSFQCKGTINLCFQSSFCWWAPQVDPAIFFPLPQTTTSTTTASATSMPVATTPSSGTDTNGKVIFVLPGVKFVPEKGMSYALGEQQPVVKTGLDTVPEWIMLDETSVSQASPTILLQSASSILVLGLPPNNNASVRYGYVTPDLQLKPRFPDNLLCLPYCACCAVTFLGVSVAF